MATKKAAKKVTKRAAKKLAPNADPMFVVSQRDFLTWNPILVFETREAADLYASAAESRSPSAFNTFKVSRVGRG